MKAPENLRSRRVKFARGAGYAIAAFAYLALLVMAGADPGPVASEPTEASSQIEFAAQLP
jgi:hypothetical protein